MGGQRPAGRPLLLRWRRCTPWQLCGPNTLDRVENLPPPFVTGVAERCPDRRPETATSRAAFILKGFAQVKVSALSSSRIQTASRMEFFVGDEKRLLKAKPLLREHGRGRLTVVMRPPQARKYGPRDGRFYQRARNLVHRQSRKALPPSSGEGSCRDRWFPTNKVVRVIPYCSENVDFQQWRRAWQ